MSATATDLQRAKCRKDFDSVDVNGNGVITAEDIDAYLDRVASALGHEPGSPKHAAYVDANRPWRDAMYELIDLDGDSEITYDEMLTVWVSASADDWKVILDSYATALFGLVDDDDDGKLTRAEFGRWAGAIGVPAEEREALFDRFDVDGSGYLTRDEYGAYLTEWATATDPDAPGNSLFGRLD